MSSNYYNKLKAFLTLLSFDLEKLNGQKLYIVFNLNMKIETIVASASGLFGLNMGLIVYESDAISIELMELICIDNIFGLKENIL